MFFAQGTGKNIVELDKTANSQGLQCQRKELQLHEDILSFLIQSLQS